MEYCAILMTMKNGELHFIITEGGGYTSEPTLSKMEDPAIFKLQSAILKFQKLNLPFRNTYAIPQTESAIWH